MVNTVYQSCHFLRLTPLPDATKLNMTEELE
ncbi:hypothetical protein KIPB_010471, partial [Kipferlia bialata]|eukprot:g10471.t1